MKPFVILGALMLLCLDANAGPLAAIAAPVLSFLGSAGGGALASGLLGLASSKLMKSSAPQMAAPKAMPTMDDQAIKDAKRRQIAAMQASSGRASTFLSDNDAKLGG